ncbi:MAG: hypothetical protein ABI603_00405 [Acidobacteriota bacterium]
MPLVWRAVGAESSRVSASSGRSIESVSAPPASSTRPTAGPSPQAAADAAPARPPVRTSDFEPGVLDRLTDDVIRRVERRVRIERERRGL